jgi:hypothetical protein
LPANEQKTACFSGASTYPEPATDIALTKMVADTTAELL